MCDSSSRAAPCSGPRCHRSETIHKTSNGGKSTIFTFAAVVPVFAAVLVVPVHRRRISEGYLYWDAGRDFLSPRGAAKAASGTSKRNP